MLGVLIQARLLWQGHMGTCLCGHVCFLMITSRVSVPWGCQDCIALCVLQVCLVIQHHWLAKRDTCMNPKVMTCTTCTIHDSCALLVWTPKVVCYCSQLSSGVELVPRFLWPCLFIVCRSTIACTCSDSPGHVTSASEWPGRSGNGEATPKGAAVKPGIPRCFI